MTQGIARLTAAAAVLAMTTSVEAQTCIGDCDGDSMVVVAEVITGVRIGLGVLDLGACPALDADDDSMVTIAELVGAVDSSTNGCDGTVVPRLVRVGDEFQVNTFTPNFQDRSDVAADGRGEFVVVWESFAVDGAGFGIAGQRFGSGGQPLGGEFVVNSSTNGGQRFPAVAANAGGASAVTWVGPAAAPDTTAVFARFFDSAGQPVTDDLELDTVPGTAGLNTAVTADAAGNFVVAWDVTVDYDVRAQRFAPSGAPIGSRFVVPSYTSGSQGIPALAASPSGGFVIAWQDYSLDGGNQGVFAQRFGADGGRLGEQFQVNTYTQGVQTRPAVAFDVDDRFVVVWETGDIFGQRFDTSGARLGTEFRVNSDTLDMKGYPDVATDPTGGFLVVWQSRNQKGEPRSFGIFGQQFDVRGRPSGDEFQVNSYTANSQSFSAVAADASGRFLAVWSSSGQDGDEGAAGGVFGQRFELE